MNNSYLCFFMCSDVCCNCGVCVCDTEIGGGGRPMRVSRAPVRVQLDVRNDVRDPNSRVKENNLNRRRHSQQNLNESSTSSNGGNGIITLPAERPSRPKSLNLNIKPEEDC